MAWCLPDTIVYAVYHVWVKVAFNTVLLAALALLIEMTLRQFKREDWPLLDKSLEPQESAGIFV